MTDYSELIARVEAALEGDRFSEMFTLGTPILAALKAVMAERDSFRAVLEGAEYGNIDGIAAQDPEFSRRLGRVVKDITMDIRRERDAAEAELARLRDAIFEASHPDFLWNAMYDADWSHGKEPSLTEYAEAASRAIRAALLDGGKNE